MRAVLPKQSPHAPGRPPARRHTRRVDLSPAATRAGSSTRPPPYAPGRAPARRHTRRVEHPPAATRAGSTDVGNPHQYQLASTTQYEPGLYGIGVAKTQTGLRDAVREACEELLRSGTYRRLLDRWGVRGGAVDTIGVNSDR